MHLSERLLLAVKCIILNVWACLDAQSSQLIRHLPCWLGVTRERKRGGEELEWVDDSWHPKIISMQGLWISWSLQFLSLVPFLSCVPTQLGRYHIDKLVGHPKRLLWFTFTGFQNFSFIQGMAPQFTKSVWRLFCGSCLWGVVKLLALVFWNSFLCMLKHFYAYFWLKWYLFDFKMN